MIAAAHPADRRLRRWRIAKIVLLVATAIVWVPIAIVMTIASLGNAR